jgi:hypothetical protein
MLSGSFARQWRYAKNAPQRIAADMQMIASDFRDRMRILEGFSAYLNEQALLSHLPATEPNRQAKFSPSWLSLSTAVDGIIIPPPRIMVSAV